jgi:3-hydroxyacyl-[acyl-carrier-protein] dehydratase
MTIREIPSKETDVIEGTFYFDPSDGIYEDHFPGCPVVPGSLIIHAFLEVTGKMRIKGDVTSVENFRFREFIVPGEYAFRMDIKDNGVFCSVDSGGRKLATGVLKT